MFRVFNPLTSGTMSPGTGYRCCRSIAGVHDGGPPRAAAVGRRAGLVAVAVPPAGRAGALVRLLHLPPVHEPRAWRAPLPPAAAARHARYLGLAEHR